MKQIKNFVLGLICLTSSAAAQPAQLPDGPGQQLLKTNCLICHSHEIIMEQRLSPETWAREVDKMAGWGSPIKEADKKALIDYLTEHFSPEMPLPKPAKERFKF